MNRSGIPRLSLCAALLCTAFLQPSRATSEELALTEHALHHRIDAVLAEENISAVAPLASDADFVRRVYLDLVGTIPNLEQTRQFLADGASDKRSRLVDQLLSSYEHAIHMARSFDVMLMERRPAKHVNQDAWELYLTESFAANKPLNQLFYELLEPPAAESQVASSSRFLLDRDCDPNLLTRDVGRIVFGRDYQCAQCHDHPLIDDYHQAEYHGLLAFLQRSFVFTSKDGKTIALAERGEGTATYKSVFEPAMTDRIAVLAAPGREAIEVAVFRADEAYAVAAADNVKPIPKLSVRKMLAEQATQDNPVFARNIANRLWGLMMPRAIVDPPDLNHSDNPPTQPRLLAVLTEALVDSEYDVRAFLRGIALSEAYQRAIVSAPQELVSQAHTVREELARDQQQLGDLEQQLAAAEDAAEQARTAAATCREGYAVAYTNHIQTQTQLKLLEQQLSDAEAAVAAATAAQSQRTSGLASLQQAADAARSAQQLIADDSVLNEALDALQKATGRQTSAIDELDKSIAQQQASCEAVRATVTTATTATATTEMDLAAARSAWQMAAAKSREVAGPQEMQQLTRRVLLRRIADAKRLLELDEAVQAVEMTDPALADHQLAQQHSKQLFEDLLATLPDRFALGDLKPLTPEQLALSALTATGELKLLQQTAEAEWEKKSAETNAVTAPETRATEIGTLLRGKVNAELRTFAQLFAAAAGQPQQDFFATADQALFFANGGNVRGWVAPRPGNLSHTLLQMSDETEIVNTAYLAVLTRPPTAEEQSIAGNYLVENEGRREAAVQDLVWSLIASPEFRFRH